MPRSKPHDQKGLNLNLFSQYHLQPLRVGEDDSWLSGSHQAAGSRSMKQLSLHRSRALSQLSLQPPAHVPHMNLNSKENMICPHLCYSQPWIMPKLSFPPFSSDLEAFDSFADLRSEIKSPKRYGLPYSDLDFKSAVSSSAGVVGASV